MEETIVKQTDTHITKRFRLEHGEFLAAILNYLANTLRTVSPYTPTPSYAITHADLASGMAIDVTLKTPNGCPCDVTLEELNKLIRHEQAEFKRRH